MLPTSLSAIIANIALIVLCSIGIIFSLVMFILKAKNKFIWAIDNDPRKSLRWFYIFQAFSIIWYALLLLGTLLSGISPACRVCLCTVQICFIIALGIADIFENTDATYLILTSHLILGILVCVLLCVTGRIQAEGGGGQGWNALRPAGTDGKVLAETTGQSTSATTMASGSYLKQPASSPLKC